MALLTQKIRDLAEHLQQHRKDYSSQRGLQAMLTQRRKLLTFLRRSKFDVYAALISRLGLKDTYSPQVGRGRGARVLRCWAGRAGRCAPGTGPQAGAGLGPGTLGLRGQSPGRGWLRRAQLARLRQHPLLRVLCCLAQDRYSSRYRPADRRTKS